MTRGRATVTITAAEEGKPPALSVRRLLVALVALGGDEGGEHVGDVLLSGGGLVELAADLGEALAGLL